MDVSAVHAVQVVVLGDLRGDAESGWRLAGQLDAASAAGYDCLVMHLPPPGGRGPVGRPIRNLVATGRVRAADPATALVDAGLVISHGTTWMASGAGPGHLPRIRARSCLVIAGHEVLDAPPASLQAADSLLSRLFGPKPLWGAGEASVLTRLQDHAPGLDRDDIPWPVCVAPGLRLPRPAGRPLRLGGVGADPAVMAATGRQDWLFLLTASSDAAGRGGLATGSFATGAFAREGGRLLPAGAIGPEAFLRRLDMLVCYPADDVPVTLLHKAMASGVTVFLPPAARPQMGEGPVYVDSGRLAGKLAETVAWTGRPARVARQQASRVSQARYLDRLARLAGPPPRPWRRRAGDRFSRIPVVLMSANGVGLGHLTRTLAVARRLPDDIRPVFVSLSSAAGIVRRCGFPVEFLPAGGADGAWFRQHVAAIMAFHGAETVLFDGNRLPPGLIQAVCDTGWRLVWMRRGLWQAHQAADPALDRRRFCDLVIVPGDAAAAADDGPTAALDDGLTVPPIRLLEDSELLPRAAARARLGLNADRPAILVQPGGGMDGVVARLDRIDRVLRRRPHIQLAVQEWMTTPGGVPPLPGLRILRGFPVARYLNAFDLTITAAGYNSFHDCLAFGPPAIFSPRRHATLDNQPARASYAAGQGAALLWPADAPETIGTLIDKAMDMDIARFLTGNARRLSGPNGAAPAARALAELARAA